MPAKSNGYKFAARWIAFNDESASQDLEEIKTIISVALIADLFGVTIDKVAEDVLKIRLQNKENPNE